jgi:hypothetical protein
MAVKVAQMTAKELQKMIGSVVEEKLLELIGDPDRGLEIKKSLRNRLLRQKKASLSVSAAKSCKRLPNDFK